MRLAVVETGKVGLACAELIGLSQDLLWAGVLCYALYPLQFRLVRATGGRRTLSALVMCLILMIGVITPLVYTSLLIAEDLTEAYRTLIASLREGEQPLLESWRKYPFLTAPDERR